MTFMLGSRQGICYVVVGQARFADEGGYVGQRTVASQLFVGTKEWTRSQMMYENDA